MAATKRPGADGSARAGKVVLGGTLPNSPLTHEQQRHAAAERLEAEAPSTVKTCRCWYCGHEFNPRRNSARYCSAAHKKAFLRSMLAGQNQQQNDRKGRPYLTAPKTHSSSSQAVENSSCDVSLISMLKKKRLDLPVGWWFEKVNEITYKLTDGVQERTTGSHGQWGGFNANRPIAVLTEIGWADGGGGRWLVGCGSSRSLVLPLPLAKRAAIALATGVIMGARPVNNPIARLNRLTAGASSALEEVLATEEDGEKE